jgi:NADH oxidase (H2O2-forming)
MKIVILGNGIAGITCARTIRKKSSANISMISSETKFFWSRTALMYIFLGHMKFEHTKPYEDGFWEKNKINLIQARIKRVDFKTKKLTSDRGEEFEYDKLLIATGSVSNKFGWPGQDLGGVTGMYNYQDLIKIEEYAKTTSEAVIVGGGLIGVELAEMLVSRDISVKMLIREEGYWQNILPLADSRLVSEHISSHGVELKMNTELKEILPDDSGRVSALLTTEGEKFNCQIVGLTPGVKPNIALFQSLEIETSRGILVNENLETSIKDVYAAGDCAEFKTAPTGRKKNEQVWYTGRMQGELAGLNILGADKPYDPGPWFNSAKFFDLEFQTYGLVFPELNEDQDELLIYPDKDKLIHLVFKKGVGVVDGVNLFGIRQRHEVWDSWLRSKAGLKEIIRDFKKAGFDPEFSKDHYPEVLKAYSDRFPDDPILSATENNKNLAI